MFMWSLEPLAQSHTSRVCKHFPRCIPETLQVFKVCDRGLQQTKLGKMHEYGRTAGCPSFRPHLANLEAFFPRRPQNDVASSHVGCEGHLQKLSLTIPNRLLSLDPLFLEQPRITYFTPMIDLRPPF